MNHLITSSMAPSTCLYCGSADVTTTFETDSFDHGAGNDRITLTVDVPVHHCKTCGGAFSTANVEDIRHEAVCAHFELLTPREIRSIRDEFDATQAQFAELTRIGRASLARWENGQLLQNGANDSLLYLLSFSDNWERLRQRRHRNIVKATSQPRLRALSEAELETLRIDAQAFEMFPEPEYS